MDNLKSNLHFKCMSFGFMFRDLLNPPKKKLNEAGITPGLHILDYGCGPGSYSIAAAKLVGQSGKVYALDIHPLAIQRLQQLVSRKGLTNVETICSDCATGLNDESIDVVLLYDTYHDLRDPHGVVDELHRILKPAALLSFSDHHMKEDAIVSAMTKQKLFSLSKKGKRSYIFMKV